MSYIPLSVYVFTLNVVTSGGEGRVVGSVCIVEDLERLRITIMAMTTTAATIRSIRIPADETERAL